MTQNMGKNDLIFLYVVGIMRKSPRRVRSQHQQPTTYTAQRKPPIEHPIQPTATYLWPL